MKSITLTGVGKTPIGSRLRLTSSSGVLIGRPRSRRYNEQ